METRSMSLHSVPRFRGRFGGLGLLIGLVVAAGLALASAPPAEGAIAFVKTVGTSGTKSQGTTLSINVPAGGVAAGNTLFIAFAINPVTGAITASDSRANAYQCTDADVQNGVSGSTVGLRTVVCSANIGTALLAGDTVLVTHPREGARAMSVAEFSGLSPSGWFDVSATGTGTGTALERRSDGDHRAGRGARPRRALLGGEVESLRRPRRGIHRRRGRLVGARRPRRERTSRSSPSTRW